MLYQDQISAVHPILVNPKLKSKILLCLKLVEMKRKEGKIKFFSPPQLGLDRRRKKIEVSGIVNSTISFYFHLIFLPFHHPSFPATENSSLSHLVIPCLSSLSLSLIWCCCLFNQPVQAFLYIGVRLGIGVATCQIKYWRSRQHPSL